MDISSRYKSSVLLDEIDQKILTAIQLDARAPFSHIASAIGVSEQTVARRYRRFSESGLVRVVGVIDTSVLGVDGYLVRIRSRPAGVQRLADALAERADVSWVTICAGGSEIVAAVRSRTRAQRDDLLLERLPAASQVTDIAAALVLHWYRPTGQAGDGLKTTVSGDHESPTGQPHQQQESPEFTEADRVLTDLLAKDGRASWSALARATGWSKSFVVARVETLQQSGILYFDVDIVSEKLGFTAAALLWLSVEPKKLAAVGTILASHEQASFTAAITGTTNLFCSVVCRDTPTLYDYLTTTVAQIEGVTSIETLPVLRRVKQKAPQSARDERTP